MSSCESEVRRLLRGVMRIEISDPALVPSLLDYLRGHVHVTADQIGRCEIEVSQLGSQNRETRRLELDLMLRVWLASHEQARVSIAE